MIEAFVFGKFLPFHKGHQAMINFALHNCERLIILVCCSDQEEVTCKTRQEWIEQTFSGHDQISVRPFNYLESELPNTSESSRAISKLWAEAFKNLVPDSSLLITSEPYGSYVASFMNIRHIAFDIPRKHSPVSATAIRKNLFENWKFLPDSVRKDLALKVIILGTESTGKSTLVRHLSQHFACTAVYEAGREIIPDSKAFDFKDLKDVAVAHSRRIDESSSSDSPLIIIDTDIHITKSYARFTFGKELEDDRGIYEKNKGSLYLYLTKEIGYVQDGTRMNEVDRNALDTSHRQILQEHNINFIEVSGGWPERLAKSIDQIEKLIANQLTTPSTPGLD